jgi:hypothetical protein
MHHRPVRSRVGEARSPCRCREFGGECAGPTEHDRVAHCRASMRSMNAATMGRRLRLGRYAGVTRLVYAGPTRGRSAQFNGSGLPRPWYSVVELLMHGSLNRTLTQTAP